MLKTSARMFLLGILVFGLTVFSFAQSQALNGQIEGFVTDQTGAAVPNASITVRNVETGTERKVVSDENGIYRVPLLPLGTYRVTVEAANFKKYVQEGIILTTGRIATVSPALEAGDVSATVTVTSDAPIADPGKIDVGRVMNTREVQNLPLVSRNPYNFALLQANVTGRTNVEFGVPRINANGYTRRTNYQLDGNNNTQADRGGIRLMPISDTFVSEVQLVTNGFSAEFGNTPGLIMNAVTPSGTNEIHGSASYRFRRTPMSSRPFNTSPTSIKPQTKVDNFTGAIGGPIIKDRWHYYGGYEYVKRDLGGEPQRTLTISEANKQRLINEGGLPASIFPTAIPTGQKVNFFIFRTDAQIDEKNRLSVRYNKFTNLSPDNIAGGANTLQRSIDFDDKSDSVGIQLASTVTTNILNEFRFQFAKRDSRNIANANSGTGPTIIITDIDGDLAGGSANGNQPVNFGAPENDDTIAPLQKTTQFQNNVTWSTGNHAIKIGAGINFIDDIRRTQAFTRYTFANLGTYNAARTGANPRSYTRFDQTFGDTNIAFDSTYYNLFAQDDWKVTRALKVNYGLRYDQYRIPKADSTAPLAASQKHKVDKDNWAPRLGMVYSLREGKYATVLRASAGIYYDTLYSDMYLRALQANGRPTFFTVSFTNSNATGAPAYPNAVTSGTAAANQDITAIAPDFENMYAIHFNAQVEQVLADDLSLTGGYIRSQGRHIPVYRSINRIPSGATLADGRPIYLGGSTISAANRLDPRFNNILLTESAGNSTYNALTLQLNKRFSKGYQFSANYTLSKSEDDAPEQNLVATQVGNLVVQDPSNRERDFGPSLADQRHTFVMSFVGRPQFEFESKALNYLLNNNQLGIIATANSGERFNIVAATDINVDGFTGSDNPVGIGRNSGKTPKQINVDMRYSRFVNFTERFKLEAFVEAINIFNINSIFQFNGLTVTTDAAGNPTSALPTLENRRATNNVVSLDSRQFQIGFKFIF
jgi:hypothetical protein